jgi:hypothetical protein
MATTVLVCGNTVCGWFSGGRRVIETAYRGKSDEIGPGLDRRSPHFFGKRSHDLSFLAARAITKNSSAPPMVGLTYPQRVRHESLRLSPSR